MLPNRFIDELLPGLSPSAAVLAIYAARHSGKDRLTFQASLPDVAAAVGLNERTVRRSIPELEGIVSVNHRPAKATEWKFLVEVEQSGGESELDNLSTAGQFDRPNRTKSPVLPDKMSRSLIGKKSL